MRARQIAGTAEDILDLSEDVDPERDHIRGPDDALVTLLEYGDFECPYCGQAEEAIRELLAAFGDDVRYVWRHLPLNDVHPHAQLAAEASEAAARPGQLLGDARHAARPPGRAALERPRRATPRSSGSTPTASPTSCAAATTPTRVSEDVASADESGVSGTPTFFINGRRHYGAYDIADAHRSRRRGAQAGAGAGRRVRGSVALSA